MNKNIEEVKIPEYEFPSYLQEIVDRLKLEAPAAIKIKSTKWYGWFWPPERKRIRLMQAMMNHLYPTIHRKMTDSIRDHLLYGTPLPWEKDK